MTYVHNPPASTQKSDPIELPSPELMLASARETYQAYCEIHVDAQPPIGVAMDRNTGRGQLIFSEQPILLPQEFFISVAQIQAEDISPVEDTECP
ncbi:hypothetical protein [Acaryochloris sp. IP29b_bin.148]|uniref:hypothetical protein n=1 Tax=Acaryochloris sp. IP29b_bin.148 TaxID=2969218 RepID=UPI0026076C71|nr:hypothetical protein [Acaryochloris sp. IP29b_bin.148]